MRKPGPSDIRTLRHIRARQPGARRRQTKPRAKARLGEQMRAEQGRRVGEHDDADLAVGEKQCEGEPGQVPVMADDSAASKSCRKMPALSPGSWDPD